MVLKSGASTDQLTIDPVSKAARVTLYDSDGREAHPPKAYAISSFFTPAATPNNLVTITGSATKTIKVYSMWIYTQTTAAGSVQFFLKKYSTAATPGVFVSAGTPVPLDSADAAATAVVGHYTTDPTPGTLVGTIRAVTIATPVLRPATPAGIIELSGVDMIHGSQIGAAGFGVTCPVTLRGTAQYLAIDFNDVALVAGQVHQYSVSWTEE